MEKFEDHANLWYAIILLTLDDKGTKTGEEDYKYRAQQNVLFEFGFFIGKLGRENVFVLYRETDNFEKPSDMNGLL